MLYAHQGSRRTAALSTALGVAFQQRHTKHARDVSDTLSGWITSCDDEPNIWQHVADSMYERPFAKLEKSERDAARAHIRRCQLAVDHLRSAGVHVHELQRARRHADRECRPHAERRREQRQRSRGEDGRSRQEAVVRALCLRPTLNHRLASR